MGGTKRLPNLSEMLSPTVQPSSGDEDRPGDGGTGAGGPAVDDAGASGGRWNGSYHCQMYKSKGRCDVCSHMVETSTIHSNYFNRRFAIHGRNIHLPASQKKKNRWFVYVCQDTACGLIYVGSTTDVCGRWAKTKKACLDRNSNNTGLYKHFMDGCAGDTGSGDLKHLTWTLVAHMDTSDERLADAGHVGGAKCRCSECEKLKEIEDKWICRLGSFYGDSGLNTRNEIKTRARVNFTGS